MAPPPPSAKYARADEPDRVDLQKSAKRQLAPRGLELFDREIGPMALRSEPRRMYRTDRGAAAEIDGSTFETAGSIQDICDPAEHADLVGSSRATARKHDAGDRFGGRQRGRRKWSHSRKHRMREAGP